MIRYLANHPTIFAFGVIILSIAFKISFIAHPFFGLEYEDAFIYSDASRLLLYNYDWRVDPFQAHSCVDGSLLACNRIETFSGHYMALPLIVFVIHKAIGYSIYNIFFVNFVASLVTLWVFIKILKSISVGFLTELSTLLFYVTTPMLNLFNTSGLAETLSSCFVVLSVYWFIISNNEEYNYNKKSYWFFAIMVIISFLIKRENLLLVGLPVLSCLLLLIGKNLNNNKLKGLVVLFLVLAIVAICYEHIARIHEMELRESEDIGAPTFSFHNLKMIFPEFVYSLFKWKWFGLSGCLFFLTSFYSLCFQKRFEFKLFASLSWLYVLLYSTHYRSYYQVHFGQISAFETLRYSSNYFPIACLCLASITFSKYRLYSFPFRLIYLYTVIFLAAMLVLNYSLRTTMNRLEFKLRISPILETLKQTTDKDYVLSNLTSIFRLYATANRNLIDANSTTERRIQEIMSQTSTGHVYFMREMSDESDIHRYPDYQNIFSRYHLTKVASLSSNYELLRLDK